MIRDYLLTTIILIVGLIGIFKDYYYKNQLPDKIYVILTSLLIATTILQYSLIYTRNQQEKYKQYSGIISGTEKIEYPTIKIGTAHFQWKGKPGEPIILVGNDPITIWLQDGKPMISALIRNENGEIIAKIDANQWTINPNLIFDRNFDNNAVEVIDNKGNVVLQVEVEEDGVSFAGVFYRDDGWKIAIGENVFELQPPDKELQTSFEPIFKYPSSLHPGKRSTKDS